ncbi:MAG: hypothetical protein NDJ90_01130 [Oligoflexia bacterium]|nr:hypothetical protein [Oligoflexia bacterium]
MLRNWFKKKVARVKAGLISGKPPTGGHAWKGTWERPLNVDEKSVDPLTVARMTDHNVRGEGHYASMEKEKPRRQRTKG